MARVIKSTHPIKHYSDGGAVNAAPETKTLFDKSIEFLRKATQSQTSKDADAEVKARVKKKEADETLIYGKPLKKK